MFVHRPDIVYVYYNCLLVVWKFYLYVSINKKLGIVLQSDLS